MSYHDYDDERDEKSEEQSRAETNSAVYESYKEHMELANRMNALSKQGCAQELKRDKYYFKGSIEVGELTLGFHDDEISINGKVKLTEADLLQILGISNKFFDTKRTMKEARIKLLTEEATALEERIHSIEKDKDKLE